MFLRMHLARYSFKKHTTVPAAGCIRPLSLVAVLAPQNSAAQRSAGAAESFACPRFSDAPSARCAGRQSRSATLSTGARVCDPQQRPICRRPRFFRLRSGKPNCCGSQSRAPAVELFVCLWLSMRHVPAAQADRVAVKLCSPTNPSYGSFFKESVKMRPHSFWGRVSILRFCVRSIKVGFRKSEPVFQGPLPIFHAQNSKIPAPQGVPAPAAGGGAD